MCGIVLSCFLLAKFLPPGDNAQRPAVVCGRFGNIMPLCCCWFGAGARQVVLPLMFVVVVEAFERSRRCKGDEAYVLSTYRRSSPFR